MIKIYPKYSFYIHFALFTYIFHGMHLGSHFSLNEKGVRVPSLVSCSEWMLPLKMARHMYRLSCQKRMWNHQSIVWWCLPSYGDILMMWGFLDDDIYISIERVYKEGCTGVTGSQIPSFEFIGQNLSHPVYFYASCTRLARNVYIIAENMHLVSWFIMVSAFMWPKFGSYQLSLLGWPSS